MKYQPAPKKARKMNGNLVAFFALWIAIVLPGLAFMTATGMTVIPATTAFAADTRTDADTTILNALDQSAMLDVDNNVRAAAAASAEQLRTKIAESAGVTDWSVVAVAPQNPQIVAVASKRDLLLSTDSGKTWQRLSQVLPSTVDTLAFDPKNSSTLYAGVDALGFYQSEDGGKTWHPLNRGLPVTPGARFGITAIAIDSLDPQRMVVSAGVWMGTTQVEYYPIGLLVTTNGGETWQRIEQEQVASADKLWFTGKTVVAANGLDVARYQID